MPIAIILALSLHVLSAVFWTGSSFTLARTGGVGAEAMFRPQMGAAALAVLTGIYLWSQLHAGGFGGPERILAAGALCAIVAAGIQGAMIGGARRALQAGRIAAAAFTARAAVAQRIAAALLAITLVCMVTARFG